MPKIGFSLQTQYSLPIAKVVALLKEAGFSAVSPFWSADLDLPELTAYVRANGMTIQSIHAPHKNIDKLWQPDSEVSAEVQKNIFLCIDACAQYEIPIMVMHCWKGLNYTFPEEPLDFSFFDRMVNYAKQKNVKVALENLEGEEYLCALLHRYRDQAHVGFCWDSGHDHCYPHRTDFLEAFGDRLIMTHLNDNFGIRDPGGIPTGKDDLHFFPYDGNIDWETCMGKLKSAARQTILNFEIKVRSHSSEEQDMPYTRMALEAYFETAGARARHIAQLYDK